MSPGRTKIYWRRERDSNPVPFNKINKYRRREWHTKPLQFSENKQLHVLLGA